MASVNEKGTHTTQPVPVAHMTLPTSNRNVLNLPLDSEGKRPWSFGLFSCRDDDNKCCLAFWCPCLAYEQNQRRLAHLNTEGVPDSRRDEIAPRDSVFFAIAQIACGMGCILQIGTRKNIRERYNIQGDAVSDCCAPFFCQFCELVQASRELQLEEESFAPAQ